MKMRSRFIFLFSFSILFLIGAGCVPGLNIGGGGKVPDGGVFRTMDQGTTWGQKTQILAVGGAQRNFNLANVITLTNDPSHPQALYAGTDGARLLISYNNC